MGYTYYNPLKVWLDPASIADVVSYIQKYLSENPIKDTEEINQIVADYIAAHPEIIGGVQSVNGETGEVVLTASNINTTGTTTIQEVLTSLSSQISDLISAIGTETVTTERITEYQTGRFWDSQTNIATLGTAGTYTAFNTISVEAGDLYEAYVRAGSSSKQYPILFVNDDYEIIEHSTRPSAAAYMTISGTVPDGATKALISVNLTTSALANISFKITKNRLTNIPELKNKVDNVASGLIDLDGKTVAIIGDSISTNGDYSPTNPWGNVPEIVIGAEDVGIELSAYVTYYDIGTVVGGHEIVAADVGTELTFTPSSEDVGKFVGVPLTLNPAERFVWWEVMQEKLGFNPIAVCWSGASITSHQKDVPQYATSYAWHDAQIRKCGIRIAGSMQRTAPDVIIIYRGTNDFSHTSYAKLTSNYFDNYNWDYPADDALENNEYGFKEGYSLTIKKLRAAYPSAKIVICTLNVFKRINYTHFPTNNGFSSLPQYNDAIREVADFFGIPVIEFDKDGITFENMETDLYIVESGKTHPTNLGHKVMANKALRDFTKVNAMT